MEFRADKNASLLSDGILTQGEYLATGIYVMIIGSIATVGNSIVILVIGKYWSSYNLTRKPHLPLTLSLAVSDLGITFFGYPYTSISGFSGRWVFNDRVCTMAGFFCFFLSMASLDALTAISVYRYIAICRPELKVRLTKYGTTMVILFCWAYGLVWAIPPLFGVSGYTLEPFNTSCSMDWASRKTGDVVFLVGTDIFCFSAHLAILIFCYTKIFKRYRHLTCPSDGIVPRKVLKREMRVAWMTFSNVVAFVVAWSPYAIVCTWIVITDNFPAKASVLPTMFAKSSCAFNPILYGAFDKKFRQMAKRIICPWLFKRVHPTSKYGGYAAKRPKRSSVFTVALSPMHMTSDVPLRDLGDNGDETRSQSGPYCEYSPMAAVIPGATLGNNSAVPFTEHPVRDPTEPYQMSAAFCQEFQSLVKSVSVANFPVTQYCVKEYFNRKGSDINPVWATLRNKRNQATRRRSFPLTKYEAGCMPLDSPTGDGTQEIVPFANIGSPDPRLQRQAKCDVKKAAISNQTESFKHTTFDPVRNKSERNFNQSLLGRRVDHVTLEGVYRYSYNMYTRQ